MNCDGLCALLDEHLVFAIGQSAEFYLTKVCNAVRSELSLALIVGQIHGTAGGKGDEVIIGQAENRTFVVGILGGL